MRYLILLFLVSCSTVEIDCEDLRHYPSKKCEVKVGTF